MFFFMEMAKIQLNSVAMPQDLKTEFAAERSALLVYVRSIVRNAEEAEDITQETMLRAHRSISGLKDHKCLVPWLYRIATNICRDHFRKKRKIRKEAQDSDSGLLFPNDLRDENAPRLDKVMECAEMGKCVQRYFKELSDSYRAVILLHDMEGLKNQEIADMLGISLDTAKVRLHLREKLNSIGTHEEHVTPEECRERIKKLFCQHHKSMVDVILDRY